VTGASASGSGAEVTVRRPRRESEKSGGSSSSRGKKTATSGTVAAAQPSGPSTKSAPEEFRSRENIELSIAASDHHESKTDSTEVTELQT